MTDVNATIVYYSSTGSVHALAEAAAEGAEKAGARVRLRKVAELAPAEAIAEHDHWQAHVERTNDVAEVRIEDVEWADAVLFGTPTRYGMVASQLKQFIDSTGSSWREGRLADKVYGAFVSTATAHGGHESTLLSLYTVFAHWGGVIVPPGYTDPIQFATGNPYGASHLAVQGAGPGEVELDAARYQARRAVETAAALRSGRRT
ncbi:NAD(P)H:quinone oxidoreductase [Solicola gregarius]|uniref:NAD(P)H:quinone oxidoreductase n=1 Tax=Solicola gregarius TaxID=2908642 RepID=A0AA46YKW2_9ACTN|nr:NAD(P)H:quinone oxidoreductase [Solicola gregarius]UYM04318.1 NAD(P)H:quinone oxidoreductase [Solicola gregarius]